MRLRRSGAVGGIGVLLGAALAGAWGVPDPEIAWGGGSARPNVLIIVTDDQRASEGTLAVMPRTRRWFDDNGTRFTRAFSTTPLCCPSRATIFTGRYAHNHGVYTNLEKPDIDHAYTIQGYLDEAGYRTALAGKFFNEWPLRRRPPRFDRWAMFDGGYFNRRYNIDGAMTKVGRYSTAFIARQSTGFLHDFDRSADATPWFLYVAPYGPHAPFTPSVRDADHSVPHWPGNPAVFEKDRGDKPPYVHLRDETYATWKENRRLQLQSLVSVDRLVHRIRKTLRELDEGAGTLVFFLSDNGYMWADHGLYDKGAPYTPSIRIPLLMRYPAQPSTEPTDGRLVANVDLAPTILDAAGVLPDPSRPMDGRSLLDPLPDRDRILTEYRNNDNPWTPPTWASTRTRRLQYVEYYDEGETIFRELYRLRSDPWQLRNVLHDGNASNDPSPARLQELASRLAADRACAGPTCP